MDALTDLTGRTMVITGATSGIGLAAADALAGRGAWLIGVGRSPARCEQAHAQIAAAHPGVEVEFLTADLASQRQVRGLAGEIRQRLQGAGRGLDVLINNAGTVASRRTVTEDDYELQFAVNHLAPFLLTHELLPLLRQAPAGRVVTVSSASHRGMRMHWADVMYRRGYFILLSYKQSKLANVLFSAEFNRRYGPGSRLRAYAADPGLVNTGMGGKGTGGLVAWFWNRRRKEGAAPEQGAATVVYLAAQAELPEPDAVYWKDCRPLAPDSYALREDAAARLWQLSARLCGIDGAGLSASAR